MEYPSSSQAHLASSIFLAGGIAAFTYLKRKTLLNPETNFKGVMLASVTHALVLKSLHFNIKERLQRSSPDRNLIVAQDQAQEVEAQNQAQEALSDSQHARYDAFTEYKEAYNARRADKQQMEEESEQLKKEAGEKQENVEQLKKEYGLEIEKLKIVEEQVRIIEESNETLAVMRQTLADLEQKEKTESSDLDGILSIIGTFDFDLKSKEKELKILSDTHLVSIRDRRRLETRLKSRTNELEKTLPELQEDVKALKKELAKLTEERNQLTLGEQNFKKKLGEFENLRKPLKVKIEKNRDRLQQLQKEQTTLSEEKRGLRPELNTIKSSLNQLNREIDQENIKAKSLRKEIETIESQIEEVEKTDAADAEPFRLKEEEMKKVKPSDEILKKFTWSERQDTLGSIRKIEKEIQLEEPFIDEVSPEIHVLKVAKLMAIMDSTIIPGRSPEWKRKYDKLKAQEMAQCCKEAKKIVKGHISYFLLRNEVEVLRKNSKTRDETFKNLTKNKNNIKHQRQLITNGLEDLSAKASSLKKAFDKETKRLGEITNKLATLGSQIEDISNNMEEDIASEKSYALLAKGYSEDGASKNQIQELDAQIKELEPKLDEKQVNLDSLETEEEMQSDIRDLNSEIKETNEDIDKETEKIAKLKKEILDLKADLESKHEAHENLESQHEETIKEKQKENERYLALSSQDHLKKAKKELRERVGEFQDHKWALREQREKCVVLESNRRKAGEELEKKKKEAKSLKDQIDADFGQRDKKERDAKTAWETQFIKYLGASNKLDRETELVIERGLLEEKYDLIKKEIEIYEQERVLVESKSRGAVCRLQRSKQLWLREKLAYKRKKLQHLFGQFERRERLHENTTDVCRKIQKTKFEIKLINEEINRHDLFIQWKESIKDCVLDESYGRDVVKSFEKSIGIEEEFYADKDDKQSKVRLTLAYLKYAIQAHKYQQDYDFRERLVEASNATNYAYQIPNHLEVPRQERLPRKSDDEIPNRSLYNLAVLACNDLVSTRRVDQGQIENQAEAQIEAQELYLTFLGRGMESLESLFTDELGNRDDFLSDLLLPIITAQIDRLKCKDQPQPNKRIEAKKALIAAKLALVESKRKEIEKIESIRNRNNQIRELNRNRNNQIRELNRQIGELNQMKPLIHLPAAAAFAIAYLQVCNRFQRWTGGKLSRFSELLICGTTSLGHYMTMASTENNGFEQI